MVFGAQPCHGRIVGGARQGGGSAKVRIADRTPAGWSAGTMWPASSIWIHERLPNCLNCAADAPAMVTSSSGLKTRIKRHEPNTAPDCKHQSAPGNRGHWEARATRRVRGGMKRSSVGDMVKIKPKSRIRCVEPGLALPGKRLGHRATTDIVARQIGLACGRGGGRAGMEPGGGAPQGGTRAVRGWHEDGMRAVRGRYEGGTRVVRGWYEGGTRAVRGRYEGGMRVANTKGEKGDGDICVQRYEVG